MRYLEYFFGKVQLVKTKKETGEGKKNFWVSNDFRLTINVLTQLMQNNSNKHCLLESSLQIFLRHSDQS